MVDVRSGSQVWVAEDSGLFRALVERALEAHCTVLRVFEDGQSLIDAYSTCASKGDRPDIVLADENLPGLTGSAVIRVLRDAGFHGGAYVMSGCIDANCRERAQHAQADGIIDKSQLPIELEKIISTQSVSKSA